MNLIQGNGLMKTYGEKMLLDDAAISIDDSDRIGIIGINGAGKSTLLRILSGQESADQGEWMRARNLSIEYLAQEPVLDPQKTVLEQVFDSSSPLVRLVGAYEAAATRLERDGTNEGLQQELLALSAQMDEQSAWALESEAKKILTKLQIFDFEQKIGSLSGGMKKRVALAGVLIRPSDLLILDEPTNHLDNDTVDFLESMLQSTSSAVVLITHDRYFLDRAMNTILELENGRLHRYAGNYSDYLEIKAQRQADESVIAEKRRKLYKSELLWMRKGVEARRTKQKARKERFYELEDSLEDGEDAHLVIDLPQQRLGSKIIEAENISKIYGARTLLGGFSYTVQSTDRIGIIGDNGAGKTTLLELLSKRIEPDTGSVARGDTVALCYYHQEHEELPQALRVLDYVKQQAEYAQTQGGQKRSASQLLETFLFSSALQQQEIARLSGGEKRRLYLLKQLMQPNNVLFLDEPTNDLDIETLGILESFIAQYNGPVITVSHDRYFLDKICNKIWHVSDDAVRYYMGNYTDYLAQRKEEELLRSQERIAKEQKNSAEPRAKQSKTSSKKLSFNEQRELDALPGEIARLEQQLNDLEAQIAASSTDFTQLTQLTEQKEKCENRLLECLERQEYFDSVTKM